METTRLFKLDEIPNEIWGAKLSELDRNLLSEGKTTHLLEGLVKDDGTIANGKIWLSYDENDKICVNCKYQNKTLFIPEEIEGVKLTEAQRFKLTSGESITLDIKGVPTTVSIDKELNCISISSGTNVKEIISERIEKHGFYEVGGYKLTDSEVKDLIEGRQIKSRVFHENDNYFAAKLSLTPDGKGIMFSDVFELSKDHALKLIESTQNNNDKFNIGAVVETGTKSIENEKNIETVQEQNITGKTKEELTNVEPIIKTGVESLEKDQAKVYSDSFTQAVDNKDFKKMVELEKAGLKLNNEQLEHLTKSTSMDANEKQQVLDLYNVPQEKIQSLEPGTQENKKEQAQKQGIAEGGISPKVAPGEAKEPSKNSNLGNKLNSLSHSVFDGM